MTLVALVQRNAEHAACYSVWLESPGNTFAICNGPAAPDR